MVLDPRLKKLAGVSARKAAAAFVKGRSEPLSDLEQGHADEFHATLEGMFLMAAVDGEVAPDEVVQLRSSVAALADLGELDSDGQLDALLSEFAMRLEEHGWKQRLDDVARRLPTRDARVFAFRLAAGVAMVDDAVEHAEAAAIDAFAAAFQIDGDESQEILREVVDELFGGE